MKKSGLVFCDGCLKKVESIFGEMSDGPTRAEDDAPLPGCRADGLCCASFNWKMGIWGDSCLRRMYFLRALFLVY